MRQRASSFTQRRQRGMNGDMGGTVLQHSSSVTTAPRNYALLRAMRSSMNSSNQQKQKPIGLFSLSPRPMCKLSEQCHRYLQTDLGKDIPILNGCQQLGRRHSSIDQFSPKRKQASNVVDLSNVFSLEYRNPPRRAKATGKEGMGGWGKRRM